MATRTSAFGIIGDIHGNFDALDRIIARHPEIPFWLCVGDVVNHAGGYPAPAAPFYFIQGNNEAFDRIAAFRAGTERIPNVHFIPNGTALTIDLSGRSDDAKADLSRRSDDAKAGPITVAGVGGTFAPTWYETPAAGLPVKGKDDKRRHFVHEEIEACKQLQGVDVLLTHEAPKPFWAELPSSTTPTRKWRREVGKAAITEVADALRPRLHCFGHHHVFAHFDRAGIPTICVDRVNRSYLLVDAVSWAWTQHETGTS